MLSLFRLLCPYPTVGEPRDLRDGLSFLQPKLCMRCKGQDCWRHVLDAKEKGPLHFVCPKGMSLVLFQWDRGKVLANGIIVKQVNTDCPMDVRKANQAQKVSWDEICLWHKNIADAEKVMDAEAERRAQEAILGLHDVKTAVSLVTRNAEAIIDSLPGATTDEKIENAPPEIKILLKSVELLHTRLSMSSIVANPLAAAYGKRHPTPIYRMFHRIIRLFDEQASRRGVSLKMAGSSRNAPPCYDSFETIPLILIDNAVKYSTPRKEVLVTVNDVEDGGVSVCVRSYGPIVPDDMRERIFERGMRTEAATKLASSGSGLGLHIAAVVAKVHGFRIRYRCPVKTPPTDGANDFFFEVRNAVAGGK